MIKPCLWWVQGIYSLRPLSSIFDIIIYTCTHMYKLKYVCMNNICLYIVKYNDAQGEGVLEIKQGQV